MRFQKKIMLLYLIFSLVIAIAFGGGYYIISMRQDMQEEYQNLRLLADQYEQQWNEHVKPMESIMSYILSDQEMLSAIRTLAETEEGSDSKEKRSASNVLSERISSYYIMNNFYRVILFNQNGDAIASRDYTESTIQKNKNIEDIEWLSKVENTKGKCILIGRHTDDWGARNNPEVFSIVKEIQGNNMGYIEVQKSIEELNGIFQTPNEKLRIVIIDSDGKVLYSDKAYENPEIYCDYVKNTEKEIDTIRNPVSGEKEVIAIQKSRDDRVSILVISELRHITERSSYILMGTIFLTGGSFLLFFIYTWISSRHLTKPIRQLKELMDNTRLENIQENREFVTSNDEIEMLSNSYKDVLERLHISMQKEKRMSFLQLRAQYDLLQAQINPHFIYNVLNVISNRGIENEDDDICELCDSLAQMLRYSTSTKARYTTIREEVEYVEQYFFLLHSRYEYRLQYEIHVDEEIYEQILPKIVLQQIIENSVSHGYENTDRNMKISVNGGRKGDFWYLEVVDNGNGFSQDVQKELHHKIERVHDKLLREQESIEMEIGGMGLVNTYARLFMVYKEDLKFIFENSHNGARVVIMAPLQEVEEAED